MKEGDYTAAVRNKLNPRLVYAWKVSDRFTAGVPDSWYSCCLPGGKDLWAEFKYYNKLPRTVNLVDGKHPKLSKLQQKWLEDRHMEGRNVVVIAGSPHGSVVLPALKWKNPLLQEEFLTAAANLRHPRHVAEWITRFVCPTGSNHERQQRADQAMCQGPAA